MASDHDLTPDDFSVIYIAGYGRSGSTLLARIIGQDAAAFCAGELVNLPDLDADSSVLCSCGELLADCVLWGPVLRALSSVRARSSAKLRSVDAATGSLYLIPALWRRETLRAYTLYWKQALHLIAARRSGASRCSVVDSSKTTLSRAARPFLLRFLVGLDVKLVHLVRDGRGCLCSNLRGEDNGLLASSQLRARRPWPVLRTSLHWLIANLVAHVFQLLAGRSGYCRLRYEDLTDRPEETLTRLRAFLGLPSSHGPADAVAPNGHREHMLAGNRMRNQPLSNMTVDEEWRRRLGLGQQAMLWLLTWPLMLAYGYRL